MFTKTIYVMTYFRRNEMAQRQSSKCRRCTQNSTDGEALNDFDKKKFPGLQKTKEWLDYVLQLQDLMSF